MAGSKSQTTEAATNSCLFCVHWHEDDRFREEHHTEAQIVGWCGNSGWSCVDSYGCENFRNPVRKTIDVEGLYHLVSKAMKNV